MAKAKHRHPTRVNGHLQLDPKNARRHSDRNKRAIRQSLEAVGGFRSIAVDGQNIIRAGNGVYEQAQELGLKVRVIDAKRDELIAVRRPDLKGKEAIRAAALDNLTADTSYADYDAEILAGIVNDDKLIKGLAEEDYRLRLLLNGPDNPIDHEKEWQGMPEFEQKDLSAFKSIHVHFKTPLDMKRFGKLVGQVITENTRSIWYPKAKLIDMKSESYQDES